MSPYAAQLVELRPMLVRMARRRTQNEAWIEDAVSETLVAALENPAAFAGRASLRTWAVGILKHKLVDQIRRHTRECQVDAPDEAPELDTLADEAPVALSDAPAEWGDPHERLARREFMACLQRSLKELPRAQWRAFMMRYGGEAETEDICRELGVSANHLAVMLHRARARLRASLAPAGFGAPAALPSHG
ncbi:MAG: sigma-70 family RNA polymerase sigma factor [Piscinibacter sp.]|nr:sigma-70 family RNA polymerase sigma factor [Piscinibacter sp.]